LIKGVSWVIQQIFNFIDVKIYYKKQLYEVILIREKVLSLPNLLIERTDFASLLDVLLRPP